MKLSVLLTAFLLVSCVSDNPELSSLGGIVEPVEEPSSKVTDVYIENLSNITYIRNEDLIINGSCVTDGAGAVFSMNVGAISKEVLCSQGYFTTKFFSSEINLGPLEIFASRFAGGMNPLPGTGPVHIEKTSCEESETPSASGCVDSPVVLPSLFAEASTYINGTHYYPTHTISLRLSGGANLKRFYSFDSSASCNQFINNNCHITASNSGCTGVYYSSGEVPSSGVITHTIGSHIQGVSNDVSLLFANDSQISSCASKTVQTDTQSPSITPSLDTNITNTNNRSVELIINGGMPAIDIGIGIKRVIVAIGTTTHGENIQPFTEISPYVASYRFENLPVNLSEGESYYFTVKATDFFGYESTGFAGPWKYQP